MRTPARVPPPMTFARARSWLPHGGALSDEDFTRRHRMVCALIALHVPGLVLARLLLNGDVLGLVLSLPVLAILGVALAPLARRQRALAASLALVLCSALLTDLFGGAVELHFHYFVAVAVIALYQDWTVYALAVAFVGVQPAFVAVMSSDAGPEAGVLALAQAAFVLAESAVLVIFWHASERARVAEDRLRNELTVGQASVRARLDEADRIRADLIATVSHEFRTPLTGVRGAALTLLKRGDRLSEGARQGLLTAILEQQERLSRVLENMLTAAQATAADPTAVAEVDAVASEVAMLASAARPACGAVAVVVEPGTVARIERQALHQVLANLTDNAQQHGVAGAVPVIAAGRDAGGVWITVSNEGRTLDDAAAGRLFEPFTQATSGPTRDAEGMGLGLYVVRRLVEVYGGTVEVHSAFGWVTVQLCLRPAEIVLTTPRELVRR